VKRNARSLIPWCREKERKKERKRMEEKMNPSEVFENFLSQKKMKRGH